MGWLRVTTACLIFTLLFAEVPAEPGKTIVSTVPIFPQIPIDQERNDFQVLINVKAGEETMPTDLIFVHSVSEESLLGHVKKAIEEIRFFSNRHETLNIIDWKPEVKQGTEFMELLQQAMTTLDQTTGEKRAGAIIVLSDGKGVDVKKDDVEKVKASNYPVYTFGLGDNLVPEGLRRLAAISMGGTFSFVDSNNLNRLSAALAVCLAGLGNVVVPGTGILRLKLEQGVTVDKVQYWPTEEEKQVIRIGMLSKGETKKIIVKLTVKRSTTTVGSCGETKLFTASLVPHGKEGQAIGEGTACVGRPQELVPGVRPDASPLVLKPIIWFNLTQKIAEIELEEAHKFVTELDRIWVSFVEEHQYWTNIDFLLEGLEQEILDLKKQVNTFKGLMWKAYIYSWISSHKTQRPTAMGSWMKVVRVFTTLEIHEVITNIITIVVEKGGNCPPRRTCINTEKLAQLISEAINSKEEMMTTCLDAQ